MLVCVLLHNLARETAGAARTRPSLRPLFEEGGNDMHVREVVIASAAKQSSFLACCAMDCFAALAMTGGTRKPPRKVSGITINYSAKPPPKPPVTRANDDAVTSEMDRRRCCPLRRRRSAGHLNPPGDDPCPSVLHFLPPPPSARWP